MTEKMTAGTKQRARWTMPMNIQTDISMMVTMNVAGFGLSTGTVTWTGAGWGWLATTTFYTNGRNSCDYI